MCWECTGHVSDEGEEVHVEESIFDIAAAEARCVYLMRDRVLIADVFNI